jgi:hypothetical protein
MTISHIDGEAVETSTLGLTDRREDLLKEGLELFHGQGDGSADNRSCSTCHVDGLSDGVIWNAGPLDNRQLTRPLRWLEGTSLIGWDGYVGSVKITGYVGGSTINHRGNTAESKALGAFLASLMPSPAATGLTERDGTLSAEGLEGKEIFEGKGACSGCHAGSLLTNREVLAEGLTPGKTDIPTLVDVARVGSWYKTGIMPTLLATVADTSVKFGSDLTEAEVAKVTRYLEESTARDFFVLHVDFGPSPEAVPVDGTIRLTFSYPVFDDAENIKRVALQDTEGENVPVTRQVDGRHVTLQPTAFLAQSAEYSVVITDGFLADDGRVVTDTTTFGFSSADPSTLQLEGDYDLTVQVPMLNFVEGKFEFDNLVSQTAKMTATSTENGASVLIDYGQDMVYDDIFVVDGTTLRTNHLPIAVGPSFLNATPLIADVQDTDDDGVVDLAEGTFKLTGPGVDLEDIAVTLSKSRPSTGCDEGSEGDHAPVVTIGDAGVTIDWGEEGALALYVADPGATLPLGPGSVEGGNAYWAVVAENFPTAFLGPVTYGEVPADGSDDSEVNSAPVGGAELESGVCYRFSVVVNFAYSHTTLKWP